MHRPRKLLAEDPLEIQRRRRLINEFWTALYNEGDCGATTWEVLDRIRDRVTTALLKRPPDVRRAESLTAKAMLLIEGIGET